MKKEDSREKDEESVGGAGDENRIKAMKTAIIGKHDLIQKNKGNK